MSSTPRPTANASGLNAASVAAEQTIAPDSTTMEQLIACMGGGGYLRRRREARERMANESRASIEGSGTATTDALRTVATIFEAGDWILKPRELQLAWE